VASHDGGDAPRLAARGIVKRFGPVTALAGVDIALRAGRVHAIVGENGAGKSTLTGVLGGVHVPDAGEIAVDGAVTAFASPSDALAAGVAVVYQDLSLLPALSVADNIMLGIQPRRGPLIDRRAQRAQVTELLARVGGTDINPATAVGDLPVARQQLVEIAKVLATTPKVIVFDEPTAVLPADATAALLALIRELADGGTAVGYISHRLNEVAQIADAVTVLRDGAHIPTTAMADTTIPAIVADMVGREVDEAFPPREHTPSGTVALSVHRVMLPGTAPDGISFEIRHGEVVGVAGLVGSGRSRLARYIVGLEGRPAGTVRLNGKVYHPRSPRRAVRRGIALVPEDRKAQGLILQLAIAHNLVLPSLRGISHGGVISATAERRLVERAVGDMAIKLGAPADPASSLSGGNQQKVVLGKWIARDPALLILDEPLRGIDVGAKAEIHRILRGLADAGLAILLISSELPEVLGVSDRVLVMRDGVIAHEFTDKPFSPDEVMTAATTVRVKASASEPAGGDPGVGAA
jgi:rhamnose transport system ATP-binding protein